MPSPDGLIEAVVVEVETGAGIPTSIGFTW